MPIEITYATFSIYVVMLFAKLIKVRMIACSNNYFSITSFNINSKIWSKMFKIKVTYILTNYIAIAIWGIIC
jgi:hypothetical protein